MIEKTYQPSEVEGRIYQAWEQAGAFKAGRPERAQAATYSIVIPPPNVTGSLHMGHALNNTLQDILVRFERMRGKDVLWQPGTDHAGIATQMVVERQMMERQEPSRREIGRDKFLEKVWAWKAESGGTIVNQLKRLGASCDWSRERFTMDEGLSKAVLKVFVELYREGLIYKDKRLVNWDPKLLTAISDLEVMPVETKGNLWHLRYPIEGKTFNPEDPSTFIVVATTRPETMLGDTAVAVHPDDERYKALIGKHVILPLVGRKIPIVGDEYSDPEKGSGAVKITPAHDFNDFEVGKRHGLPQINVLTIEAKITFADEAFNAAGETSADFAETKKLEGLDRFAARKAIVARLEEMGLVAKIEPHGHVVPHGDRSNVVIEPFLTDQWYVNAAELAKPAIAMVREGKTTFVPKNWEATYFNWMENIQPWCISRQLWWGHQIPAWYGPDGKIFVAESEGEALQAATQHYGCRAIIQPKADLSSVETTSEFVHPYLAQTDAIKRNRPLSEVWIRRDEDVLDTWFSSALWPFSTLGWPEKTRELARFYPTSTLVTGFDIIFFWVARMMMMGLHFMKKERPDAPADEIVPFKDVYIHRLVRDASGAKMSKSKGNVVDPLGIIDQFGADALRFTLARNVAPSHDIRLGPQDVENNRNFATKLWNAARFVEFNGAKRVEGFDPKSAKEALNRWIAHETQKAAAEITQALEVYAFADAAGAAYRFVWNVYCDWYVELSKPLLTGPDGPAKDETRATAAWALDEILKLLHPFMPFITEELWAVTAEEGPKRQAVLALSDWPALEGLADDKAEAEIGWVIDLITAIRSIRAEMNINVNIPIVLAGASVETQARAERWAEFIKRLARVSEISSSATAPEGSVQLVVRGEVAALPLKGVIDLGAERARLAKEMQKAEADIARSDNKLNNPNFVARAAEEVVEEEKEKRDEAVARKAKIAEALERLKGAE
ncbi:valine--tRNA ligase [Pseudolabrys taiwanensis]|uniref:Valine--tRNA ligase n=1 Tax=Pseudolabrys taiwanensis TaxID=331696 RepID=A0A345ZSC9_9HYPH|nr:valine--tRNA ligase [Pseudolabrys taiwanensis]AXK79826.1 valine--tRNA ligase [Pseudolabrys taiwanensis]